MNFWMALVKKKTELVLMFPFVLLGKVAGRYIKLSKPHQLFLFFPSTDIGGANKVNADILKCVQRFQPLVVFSKRPRNDKFRFLFMNSGVHILNLYRYIDYKPFHFINFIFRGVLSTWINKAKKPVVFGGECIFFYKIIPHLKKEAKCVELLHLNTWLEYSLAFIPQIDLRICSTPQLKREMLKLYNQKHLPEKYFKKIDIIDNMVDNLTLSIHEGDKNLKVLFMGRNSPQKRPELAVQIAQKVLHQGAPVQFIFVGDLMDIFTEKQMSIFEVLGTVHDEKKLAEIYDRSDVLLLTSLYEGLPLVVMEMMAKGKTVLSTAVGSIADYISHENSGLLLYEIDEEQIVNSAVAWIIKLSSDNLMRRKLGLQAHAFAMNHFSRDAFCRNYQEALDIDRIFAPNETEPTNKKLN